VWWGCVGGGLIGDPSGPGRELLDLTVAAAGIGTFDWDLTTGTLNWDERLLELFGYDPDRFARRIEASNARLHPDDVDRVGALLTRGIDTVGEYSAEYRVCLPGGQQRWLAAHGRALADEHGGAARLLGAAWDITDRRRAQDRIAAVVEAMAVGFIALDRDWVMTHPNAETERISGTARAHDPPGPPRARRRRWSPRNSSSRGVRWPGRRPKRQRRQSGQSSKSP
jgi:PAS domain S-box-containing protein